MNASQPPAEDASVALGYSTMRVVGFIMLLLMVAAIVYASWIALANWGEIRV